MQKIILDKFKEWTTELISTQARIKVFEQIRDIPYYLVPQIEDPYEWAASILEAQKGSCSPKHYLLGLLFGKLGIPVKYATYLFRWDQQPIKYTEELKELAQGSPIGYHLACKANINGWWILVDVTWDMALKEAGFPVNMTWDGASETFNAVLPLEEVMHDTPEARLNYVQQKKSLQSADEKATYAEFILKFNAWLEGLRV